MAGVADAILVLQRARGEADAKLHITGRDVEEREIGLRFDAASGVWSLDGNGKSFQIMTPERRAVLVVLEGAEPMMPKIIAEKLNKPSGTVRKLLLGMRSANLVHRLGDGRYTVPTVTQVTGPEKTVQDGLGAQRVREVTHEGNGNTSDPERMKALPGDRSVTLASDVDSFAIPEEPVNAVTSVTADPVATFVPDIELECEAIALQNTTPNIEDRNRIGSLLQQICNLGLPQDQRNAAQEELFILVTSLPSPTIGVQRLMSNETGSSAA